MNTRACSLVFLAGVAIAEGVAWSGTVATFADPAPGPAPSLFQYNASTNVLTGGWAGSNLLLRTPAIPSVPDFPNAHFTMTPLSAMSSIGPAHMMGPGQINFFDSANAPLLTITFGAALLTSSLGMGSSDFEGLNVTFSGPILTGFISIDEAFAFSFANPVAMSPPGSYTVTSSFTASSVFPIPASGTASLLVLGGAVVLRRRR